MKITLDDAFFGVPVPGHDGGKSVPLFVYPLVHGAALFTAQKLLERKQWEYVELLRFRCFGTKDKCTLEVFVVVKVGMYELGAEIKRERKREIILLESVRSPRLEYAILDMVDEMVREISTQLRKHGAGLKGRSTLTFLSR